MEFKECYVSKNGISCITNINTLHNFKKITTNLNPILFFNNIKKYINKNNLLFYLSLRSCEIIYNILIKNNINIFLINCKNNIKNLDTNDLLNIMFS